MKGCMTRRDFLIRSGLAGSGLLFLPLGRLLTGGFWEEHANVRKASESFFWELSPEITVGKGASANYPVICLFRDEVYVAVTEQNGESESLRIYTYNKDLRENKAISIPSPFSFNAHASLSADGEKVYLFWQGKSYQSGEILFGSVDDLSAGAPTVVSKVYGNSGWIRSASDPGGRILLVWQDDSNKKYECRYCFIERGKAGTVQTVPEKMSCRHPDVIWNGDSFYLTMEQYSKDHQSQIYLRKMKKDGIWENPVPVTTHPAGSLHPSLAASSGGKLFIASYSPRKGIDSWDMPRWIYLNTYDGRRIRQLEPLSGMDLAKDLTDQSLEYPRLCMLASDRLFLTGRPSQNFFLQLQGNNGFQMPHRLGKDGWGGRGLTVETVANDDTVYTVRRDLGQVVLQKIKISDSHEKVRPARELPVPAVIPALKNPHYEKFGSLYPKSHGKTVFFGDLHHHTAYSDGMGDPDEYYSRARDLFGDDFFCLTDHDNFVGRPMQPGDWQMMKDVADHYNVEEMFVTFYGIEWTTGRYPKSGYGHRNIYSINPDMPLIDHTREPWKTSSDLLREIREFNGIAVPHHTGWTGTDWENADDHSQPLCEIVSNHGAYEYMGNRPIHHRGGIKGCFIQDGLVLRRKFGVIGSSDSHGLIWHHRAGYKRNCIRSGLTAVMADSLTRESLFMAMKNRHTYATSGIKLFLRFECENGMHGYVISTDKVPEFNVECISPDPVLRIIIVKNNRDVYEYGGDGLRSRFSWTDPNPEPGKESWYYLRVITRTGEMAWSSPIWITPLI